MAIFLFTDFGTADIYVGQVKAVLLREAPGVPVIDLLHEAPVQNARASAHLLAALSARVPPASVVLAVVDPGVGSERDAVVVRAGDTWFVGPDNGLLSVVAARAPRIEVSRIVWRPEELSPSFHGRDLFAPVAGWLACGEPDAAHLEPKASLDVNFGGGDLHEVIYLDHYGNAMTGIRADAAHRDVRLRVMGRVVTAARVFSDVAEGELFWYPNSIGLVEIAANRASAAAKLRLDIGERVALEPAT
jgi:S-adenosylmethionine hydrolase